MSKQESSRPIFPRRSQREQSELLRVPAAPEDASVKVIQKPSVNRENDASGSRLGTTEATSVAFLKGEKHLYIISRINNRYQDKEKKRIEKALRDVIVASHILSSRPKSTVIQLNLNRL